MFKQCHLLITKRSKLITEYYTSTGPRTIHEKVTNQSLRIMSPKSCRTIPFLNNADQHYIVPALKRCVELLVNVCRSLITYLYITRGPNIYINIFLPKIR